MGRLGTDGPGEYNDSHSSHSRRRILCQTAFGGPITDEFRCGYGGIPWGSSLADLVGTLLDGHHYFAVTSTAGERNYDVINDEPLLGEPRRGMSVQYGIGKWNTVDIVGVNVPYERLGSLGAFDKQSTRVI